MISPQKVTASVCRVDDDVNKLFSVYPLSILFCYVYAFLSLQSFIYPRSKCPWSVNSLASPLVELWTVTPGLTKSGRLSLYVGRGIIFHSLGFYPVPKSATPFTLGVGVAGSIRFTSLACMGAGFQATSLIIKSCSKPGELLYNLCDCTNPSILSACLSSKNRKP